MSRFEPVHLPEDRHLNGKVSQTMLRAYNSCARAAYLYALHKGTASTPEMQRGSGLHAVTERSISAAVENGEVAIPGEVVKAIVNEVLADPEFAIPVEEHDYLREMSYRWAAETAIDPGKVIACESMFALELGGYQVRCRIDFAELLEDGAVAYVADWKSSRSAPAYEEVARKRRDGSLMAKNFQMVLYALMLAFGVPVRVETCLTCEGVGEAARGFGFGGYGAPAIVTCPTCDGAGVVEIPEPFPVAPRAQTFRLEFVYPGIEDRDGKMLRRPVTLTRLELEEYRASLEGLLARLANSEATGDWPAVAGNHCAECPASALCPIPREVRDGLGEIRTDEDASAAAEVLFVLKRDVTALGKLVRDYLKEQDRAVLFGQDMVAEIAHETAEKVVDREAMFAAMERARLYGEPFDRAAHVRTEDKFPLKLRALSVDEIEAASEGSNGDDGDEGQGLDERFGADAPF